MKHTYLASIYMQSQPKKSHLRDLLYARHAGNNKSWVSSRYACFFSPCANRGRKHGTLCRAEPNQPWSPRAGRSGDCGPSGSRCCACSMALVAEHVGSTAWVTALAEPDLLTKAAAAAGLKAELPPLTLDLDLPAAEGKRIKSLELPQLPLGAARPAQGLTCLQAAHALWHAVQRHSTPVFDTS